MFVTLPDGRPGPLAAPPDPVDVAMDGVATALSETTGLTWKLRGARPQR
jgi:hypothetical protein